MYVHMRIPSCEAHIASSLIGHHQQPDAPHHKSNHPPTLSFVHSIYNTHINLPTMVRMLIRPVVASSARALRTVARNARGGVATATTADAGLTRPDATTTTSMISTLPPSRITTRSLSYYAQKKQAKERRRELYNAKVERQERLPTRRSGPRDALRREFRSFFISKKVDEEYMERKARQAGLDWNIQVAVILERQNIVLPDKETWETEMDDLQTYLMQFGKQYPKGLFGIEDYDKVTANLAMTEEELLALLPEGFTPAPRETEADATGNVRTTDRKLKTSVYLTVQDSDTNKWMLPTVTLLPDETFFGSGPTSFGGSNWTASGILVSVSLSVCR